MTDDSLENPGTVTATCNLPSVTCAPAVRRVRNMEPRDLKQVWSLCLAQNRRDRTSYPVPEIFELDEQSPNFGRYKPNVALALVTEVDGRVRAGHVFLRTIEEMSFGGAQADMAFSIAHIPMALEILEHKGYDDVHTFVPVQRAADLTGLLGNQGFTRIDHRLAHFFRTI
jgi:hypothetical protein